MASEGRSRRRRRNRRRQRRIVLPEYLQREIQVRLPLKSLVRFQSVCKTWQSRFADLYHLLRGGFDLSSPTPQQNLHSMVPGLCDTPLPPPPSATWPWQRHNTVLGSRILCLISIHRSLSPPLMFTHSTSSTKFALLNPGTGNFIFTNPIPPQFSSTIPLSEPSEVVFGFGALNSEHKIVVLIRYGPNFTSSVLLLYSLISGKWTKKTSCIPQEARIAHIYCGNYCRGGDLFRECFVSGCWHWLIRLDDERYGVLSFNFGDEEFRLIGMPEPPDLTLPELQHLWLPEPLHHESKTFVLQERLAAMNMVCLGAQVKWIEVWVMTEYGAEESWNRVYRIKPPWLYNMVRNFIRIDCRKDETAAAGFVVGSLFFKTITRRGFRIVCCNDDGHRVVDGCRAEIFIN